MTNPTALLTTKISIPQLRNDLVLRERLNDVLDAGLAGKMTLVSAPAGFGKTTQILAWLQSLQIQDTYKIGWFSIDANDNDLARFVAYYCGAIKHNYPKFEIPPTEFLSAQSAAVESILTASINEIARNSGAFILVLDDYHLIDTQAIHEALAFVLEHQPGHMHLVLTTRADPPLPLALLRGRGQLNELRQSDLKFSTPEAVEFLSDVMGFSLGKTEIETLSRQTEGWITGLQMAAVSMRGQQDLAGFVRSFEKGHRYILDYLMEEVVQQQDAFILNFLLQTSILERFSAPLCDYILDVGNSNMGTFSPTDTHHPITNTNAPQTSQAILEYLETCNMFIEALDSNREWFRYHRLFADLLRKHLGQGQDSQIVRLHRRASQWFQDNGLTAEAIEHALKAEDHERAASLITSQAEAILMRSEFATLRNWLVQLPEEILNKVPILRVYSAWTLFYAGHSINEVENQLRDLEQANITYQVLPFRAMVAIYRGDMEKSMQYSRQALEFLGEEDQYSRSIALWLYGVANMAENNIRQRIDILHEMIQLGRSSQNNMITIMSLAQLGDAHIGLGKLEQAQTIFEQALFEATNSNGEFLPLAGEALRGLGVLQMHWNNLSKARDLIETSIAQSKRWGSPTAIESFLFLSRILQAQGQAQSAHQMLENARQLSIQFDVTDIDDQMVAMEQAQLNIFQGHLGAAHNWIKQRGLAQDLNPKLVNEAGEYISAPIKKYEHIIQARLLVAAGEPRDALTLIQTLRPQLEAIERTHLIIEITILETMAHLSLGDQEQAIISLRGALDLAQPGGYIYLFVKEGASMAHLIYQAAEQEIHPDYTRQLLGAFPTPKGNPEKPVQDLIEPLSQRELEVLALIASGASNPEIAAKLFIAINTVKKHVSTIFRKLNVTSRTQAVAQARDLNLVK
jgi:LuxR family transcriptional regulator, maltose regulon positive regulatory protein